MFFETVYAMFRLGLISENGHERYIRFLDLILGVPRILLFLKAAQIFNASVHLSKPAEFHNSD